MGISFRSTIVGLAALGSLAVAPIAWAGCGEGASVTPASWQSTPGAQAKDLLTLVSNANAPTSIVGMWSVQFFAGGAMIDFGYSVWHSDGTEFLNSGGRSPATQNYCLGVWAQTGPFSYRLNHFALSYDPGGTLNGKVNIKEDVILDPKGNEFSGPFTIDVFDPTTGAPLQHVAGRIVGRRVTVN